MGRILLFLYLLWSSPFAAEAALSGGQMPTALLTEVTENFDGDTPIPSLPTGWVSVAVAGSSGVWVTNNGTVHANPGGAASSAPNLVYFNAWSIETGASARLYFQFPIVLTPALGAAIKFLMYHETETLNNDRLQVQVSTNGGATWTSVGLEIPRYDGSTGWKRHTVSLDEYAGQSGVLVGLLGISAHGNDIHLDDIAMEINLPMASLLSENFDSLDPPGKLPAAWLISPVVNSGGDWLPYPGTKHPAEQPAHTSPNLVYFNSFSVSGGTQARLQYAFGFDLRTATEVFLTFWMYHDLEKTGSNDRLQVQVSTDGILWQNVGYEINRYNGSKGWEPYRVDLQAFLGQPDLRVGFLGISGLGSGSGNDIHLDDIALYRNYYTQFLPILFN
jgi:hypothetical protein